MTKITIKSRTGYESVVLVREKAAEVCRQMATAYREPLYEGDVPDLLQFTDELGHAQPVYCSQIRRVETVPLSRPANPKKSWFVRDS